MSGETLEVRSEKEATRVEPPNAWTALEKTPVLIGGAVFLFVLLILVALSWDDISQPRYEDGDFAANSILIDEAMTLDLLHGNYSRTSFYHPGPGLLYVQAGSQLVFHEWLGLLPTPYNAHLLGILILNAALLALAAAILFRATLSVLSVLVLVSLTFAYSLQFGNPGLGGLLGSTWMPHVYVWPFLLLLVSGASLAVGRGQDLWIFVLAGGLLVHGHVSFLLPVAVFSALAGGVWIARHRSRWFISIPLGSRIASAVVLGILLLPLLLQLTMDYPGQFGNYFQYLRETELPARTIEDVARFVTHYWGFDAVAVVLVPLVLIAAFASALEAEPATRRGYLVAVLLACLVASATTALYGFAGVDDFTHNYLGLFYVSVPILVWTVLGTGLLERALPARPVLMAVTLTALAVSWVVMLVQPTAGSGYAGSQVGAAYDAIDVTVGNDDPLVFTLAEHNDWIAAIGVLEQARRDGREACARIGAGILRVVFTEHSVCGEIPDDASELLVTSNPLSPTPSGRLLYESDSLRIWEIDG